MNRRSPRQAIPVGDTDPYAPTPARPVRARARALGNDVQFEPHHHPWGQLAYCARGLLQVTVSAPPLGAAQARRCNLTAIVPPSRAMWVPPGASHVVTILENAQLYTLYIDPSVVPPHWQRPRVLMVSPLMRELVLTLALATHADSADCQQALDTLLLAEMTAAATQSLAVPMPDPRHGDRRLRALCETMMRTPSQHTTLADWARHSGASERTLARLFREELGTSFRHWRQLVVLAHALPLLNRGTPVSAVAAACGYTSDSAFTAMFKAAMGQPPTRLHPTAQR
ncbi:AraC family transcriptional regulator [Denitromonas iodatirespirans]|uniref:Helix-turn-helix transcriptional regulator n=1 Tax=Denitromonas iodatirespirans TaxID=2795389 RepID=A0A944D9R7_DENI1|nr:helix-turn-helix transcriptional regulator [Denitromonas iodatirespirans]MBT0961041.1 helix-turn-helix transcriptional regulator [Denitromonas iodatirespirans]